jgi:hypothetical protein
VAAGRGAFSPMHHVILRHPASAYIVVYVPRFWTFHALREAFASVAKPKELQLAYGRARINMI